MVEIRGFQAVQQQGVPEDIDLQTEQDEATDAIVQQVNLKEAEQKTTAEEFEGPDVINYNIKTAKDKKVENPKEAAKAQDKAKGEAKIQKVEKKADEYSGSNPELKKEDFVALSKNVKKGDTKQEILQKVKDSLKALAKDPSLVTAALNFLFETTDDPELQLEIKSAIDDFTKENQKALATDRNVSELVIKASKDKVGVPSEMREFCRDVIHNPRDTPTLFEELSKKYPYNKLTGVISFFFHELGDNLKKGGSQILPAELVRLRTEVTNLQAISGIYKFFQGRMNLVKSMFERDGLTMPPQITFEVLAKAFMSIVQDRNPRPEKIDNQTSGMGIDDSPAGKINVITQWRDGVKASSPIIFRGEPHIVAISNAIMYALENLEDQKEDLLTQQEDDFDIKPQTKSQRVGEAN